MFNFLDEANRLSTLESFDDTTVQTLAFLAPNKNGAYLFLVDEGSIFKKYGRNGNKKTCTRQVETQHGVLDLDENLENLYLIKPEDRAIMEAQDFVDSTMGDAGVGLIGNIATFYRFTDLDGSSATHMQDGRTIDASRGNRAINDEFTGMVMKVTKIKSEQDTFFTLNVDGKNIRVHKNAKISC